MGVTSMFHLLFVIYTSASAASCGDVCKDIMLRPIPCKVQSECRKTMTVCPEGWDYPATYQECRTVAAIMSKSFSPEEHCHIANGENDVAQCTHQEFEGNIAWLFPSKNCDAQPAGYCPSISLQWTDQTSVCVRCGGAFKCMGCTDYGGVFAGDWINNCADEDCRKLKRSYPSSNCTCDASDLEAFSESFTGSTPVSASVLWWLQIVTAFCTISHM
eukprot:TRINITY_DN108936_c0_g1_i1.p1 TRINITY_DN108936_c0_g1~~TRINITY_DN108936_c0_g1_i1.p1  ORF type:complete len:228 (-),score=16.08 TRINITY_DN108936_c0_g1_i1:159-806(-)